MLTKQKVSMKKETVIGLRTVKAAIQDYGGVDKIPITLDLVKTAENSYRLYNDVVERRTGQKYKRQQKE